MFLVSRANAGIEVDNPELGAGDIMCAYHIGMLDTLLISEHKMLTTDKGSAQSLVKVDPQLLAGEPKAWALEVEAELDRRAAMLGMRPSLPYPAAIIRSDGSIARQSGRTIDITGLSDERKADVLSTRKVTDLLEGAEVVMKTKKVTEGLRLQRYGG